MPSYKLYDILGVSKGVSAKDLKKAYHKLSLEHHPDKGGDPERFKDISHAYQVLSDDKKRELYDQLGDEQFREGEMGGAGGIDPRDLFAQFFGGGGFEFPFGMNGMGPRPNQPRKAGDHRHVWQIGLKEAYFGIEKTLKVSTQVPCRSCLETCYVCQGRGVITQMQRMGLFTQMTTMPCRECQGGGRSVKKGRGSCGECQGKGSFTREQRVELKAPRGVDTGYLIRMEGLGEASPESDALNGDLLIEVLVQPHPEFRREGNDLHLNVPISFADAIGGKTIAVSHFDGVVEVSTASFGVLQPNKKYRVPKKGMPGGHLYLEFKIQYPTEILTDEQRSAFRSFLSGTGLQW